MKDEEKDRPSFLMSFIVRFWVEPPSTPGESEKLRGQITHVPSGERRYLQRLDEICAFISSYLQEHGILEKQRMTPRKRWWCIGRDKQNAK
jgi:hypothetical protein